MCLRMCMWWLTSLGVVCNRTSIGQQIEALSRRINFYSFTCKNLFFRWFQCRGDNDFKPRNKRLIFKNNAPFTSCISKINNTFTDNSEDLDIVMPICNLLEHSDNYSMTSGSLWNYYIIILINYKKFYNIIIITKWWCKWKW